MYCCGVFNKLQSCQYYCYGLCVHPSHIQEYGVKSVLWASVAILAVEALLAEILIRRYTKKYTSEPELVS